MFAGGCLMINIVAANKCIDFMVFIVVNVDIDVPHVVSINTLSISVSLGDIGRRGGINVQAMEFLWKLLELKIRISIHVCSHAF